MQDPTYYVLLTYVQHVEATIDKILNALQKIQRFDIIIQIKNDIYDLIDKISQNAKNNGILIFITKAIIIVIYNLIYKFLLYLYRINYIKTKQYAESSISINSNSFYTRCKKI